MIFNLEYIPIVSSACNILSSCFANRQRIVAVDHLTLHTVDPNDWDIVFVLCAETTFKIRNSLDRLGDKLVLLYTSNEVGLEKYTKFFFPFWLFCVDEANRRNVSPGNFDYSPDYVYNALLGRAKDSRTSLLEKLDQKNLLERGIISYHTGAHYSPRLKKDPTPYFSNIWKWENEEIRNMFLTDINYLVRMDSTTRTQNGHFLSCLLPWRVYNDSLISIVSETDHNGSHSFLTEKTWKPMIAGHPFLFHATADHENFLESLGFEMYLKTYGDVKKITSIVSDLAHGGYKSYTFKDWSEIAVHNRSVANPDRWKSKLHYWLLENFVY